MNFKTQKLFVRLSDVITTPLSIMIVINHFVHLVLTNQQQHLIHLPEQQFDHYITHTLKNSDTAAIYFYFEFI